MTTNYTTAAGVQQFSITIASGSTTGTATTGTAVGTGAYITYGGSNPSVMADFAEAGAYLSWATASGTTTITATRQTGPTGTVVVTGSITDGDTTNLIKAVQQGTVSISAGTSGTAAVTAPSADGNAAIHFLGNTGTGTTLSAAVDYASLTQSSTTVTAACGEPATLTVGFCLIEFKAACMTVNAVQRISAASSSSVTSWTASIINVVMNNAISFWGGKYMGTIATNDTESMLYGALTAVGTFTVTVNTGVAASRTYTASIVEFNSGVLNSAVQRGVTTLTGATSNTSAILSVNITYSGLAWLGNSTTAGTSQLGESTGAGVLTGGSTVTVEKATSTANITGSWEVFEFPAYVAPSTVNSWYPRLPDIASSILFPAYSHIAEKLLPLNLPMPWLPRLPDIASVVPPIPQGSVHMKVQPLNLPIRWLPRIADAPPITPPDKPSFFGFPLPLNFRLPWLPRIADAIPPTPADKPNYFAPRWLLNLPIRWLPKTTDAIPLALPDKPNYFAPSFTQAAVVTILSWFSRIADAPPVTPPDKQNFFSPIFPLNFRLPWLPRIADAPPLTPADKPNYFAPRWLLNLPMRWLPTRVSDAPPIIPPDKPSFFAPKWLLNFPMPWIPRVSDAAPLTLADKPTTFLPRWPLNLLLRWLPEVYVAAPNPVPPPEGAIAAPILPLNLPIPWLSKTHDAPPVIPPDKPNTFMPGWILNFPLPWLPKSVDAVPLAPATRQHFFAPLFSYVEKILWWPWVSPAIPPAQLPPESITVLPEPFIPNPGVGILIKLRHKKTTLLPDFADTEVDLHLKNSALSPDAKNVTLNPKHRDRMI